MEFTDFEKIMRGLERAYCRDIRVSECGVDISYITDILYDCVFEALEQCYPAAIDVIINYCWELEFGVLWTPGYMADEVGRDVKLSSVYDLWLYLESTIDKDPIFIINEDKQTGIGCYHTLKYSISARWWWAVSIDITGTELDRQWEKLPEVFSVYGDTNVVRFRHEDKSELLWDYYVTDESCQFPSYIIVSDVKNTIDKLIALL